MGALGRYSWIPLAFLFSPFSEVEETDEEELLEEDEEE
jgi:hypothetical protein